MLIIMFTSGFLFYLSVSFSLQIVFSLFTGRQRRPLQCQLDDRCRPACSIEVKNKDHYFHHIRHCSHPRAHWTQDSVATLNQINVATMSCSQWVTA